MNFFKCKFYRWYVSYLKSRKGCNIQYLKAQYYLKNNRPLNLEQPQEFMEKISWLKLFYYTEAYKDFADKYEVRRYVRERVGDDVLNEVYGVYDCVEEIIKEELPQQFVLKCTHASGTNIIVRDKDKFDCKKAKAILGKWMAINYYYQSCERVYKDIKPRIIAEKYLCELAECVIDYKFYCFHGRPEYVLVKLTENGIDKKAYYTMDWQKVMPEKPIGSFLDNELEKPVNFEEMKTVAARLAGDFIFMRVDLYSIQGRTLFGEMTFFPTGGIKRIFVERLNKEMGGLIRLPGLS